MSEIKFEHIAVGTRFGYQSDAFEKVDGYFNAVSLVSGLRTRVPKNAVVYLPESTGHVISKKTIESVLGILSSLSVVVEDGVEYNNDDVQDVIRALTIEVALNDD